MAHVGKQRAGASVEAVTPQDVKAFRDLQVKEGKSETTANLALKTLRSLFNDARREGLISTNPAEAVKTFDVEKEARDVFTHEQLCALVAKASPEWKTAILLAYYSGLRLRDAVSLSWDNVNFDLRQIRYFPRKSNRGQRRRRPDWKKHVTGQLEVPLMPEVEAHLLSLPSSDDPAAKLCPTLAAKSTGGNRGLSRMFQRVMAAAGIHSDRGVEKKGKGRQFKTLGFHSLRHTFVSELANADVPADVRRQISGHSDEKDSRAIYAPGSGHEAPRAGTLAAAQWTSNSRSVRIGGGGVPSSQRPQTPQLVKARRNFCLIGADVPIRPPVTSVQVIN